MKDDNYDEKKSKAARDAAIDQVARAAFMETALLAISRMRAGRCVIGEDIRRELEQKGIKPHHCNAWGALINRAVKLEMLHETGNWVAMSYIRSHGRRTPQYLTMGGSK